MLRVLIFGCLVFVASLPVTAETGERERALAAIILEGTVEDGVFYHSDQKIEIEVTSALKTYCYATSRLLYLMTQERLHLSLIHI